MKTDEFTVTTPFGERTWLPDRRSPGESKEVIIVASHYDTKFYKDMMFIGANDPATSVATLLELGECLRRPAEPKMTYWLVFFDGEDLM